MKYLNDGEIGKRRSKTNLTRGAFGTSGTTKGKSSLWKKLGVKIPLATKKGKLPSTYVKFDEGSNKYVPKN
jgi:hypothetical protein